MRKARKTIPDNVIAEYIKNHEKGVYKLKELYGIGQAQNTLFRYSQYRWLVNCPHMISNKCCNVMKKSPVKSFEKKTGKKPMLGQMAQESKIRTQRWIASGCNAFDGKRPQSNPMAFWREQDVLLYIYENHMPIASVYGEVVKDNEIDGQLDVQDLGIFDYGAPILKTTGCNRTGCMFCGFGCHLEKQGEGRFERMKITHPKQYEWIMKPWDEGGLGYKDVINWLNEHGNLHIRY